MPLTQTIAIIGATGNTGSAIAKGLAKGPYRLLLFGSDEIKLTALSNQIRITNTACSIETTNCPVDASWEADIIIPALPFETQKEIALKIKEVSTGKIVISIVGSWLNDTHLLETSTSNCNIKELQLLLPYSKVVNVYANGLSPEPANPVKTNDTEEIMIAGDDTEAMETVGELFRTIGFKTRMQQVP